MPGDETLSFGPYRLDLAGAQLWRDHHKLKLTGKAFAVLRHLVTHAGELVTKDELFAAVWPQTVVSDDALASCIKELRQVLHDQARERRYIETVHRRGFRFIAHIEPQGPEVQDRLKNGAAAELAPPTVSHVQPGPSSGKEARAAGRWPLAAVAATIMLVVSVLLFRTFSPDLAPPAETTPAEERPALPLPDKPSIAVLPFTNMSGDPEQDYFSDGMTDDIITDLSQISGLFVIARHSVFTYKGQAVKVEEVGRELGVRYVLEGSTRKADSRVRINAQLIDASTGGHVWAERYDRELADIFALQDEVTQQIVATLRVEMQTAERDRVRRIPTDNLNAYDAWLRGLEYRSRRTQADNAQARQWFERAIELDPQYAQAYAWLGFTYLLEWVWWTQDPPLLERAGELARQALALDNTLPMAHSLLGNVYRWQNQPDQAVAEGERAVALDPNDARAYVWLADILNFVGRSVEAIDLVQQAMRLNPHYPAFYANELGFASFMTGQYEGAVAAFKDALRRNPNYLSAYMLLASSYGSQWAGQWSHDPQTLERAVEAAEQAVARGDSTFWAHGVLSQVYLLQQRYEEALAAAERALALIPHNSVGQTYVGHVLTWAGRPAESLARMEPVNCPTAWGFAPPYCFLVLGDAYFLTGRHEEALGAYHQALTHTPHVYAQLWAHLMMAASYSELGRTEEAGAEIAEVLNINPQFSLAGMQQTVPFKDPADLDRLIAALRNAGLE